MAYFYSLGGITFELKNGCELIDSIATNNYICVKAHFKLAQPTLANQNNMPPNSPSKANNSYSIKKSSRLNSPNKISKTTIANKPHIKKLIHKALRVLSLKLAYEKSKIRSINDETKLHSAQFE
jgi:hypothetical protein